MSEIKEGICTIGDVDVLVDGLTQLKVAWTSQASPEVIRGIMDRIKENFKQADLTPREFIYFMSQFQKMLDSIKPDDLDDELNDDALSGLDINEMSDDEIEQVLRGLAEEMEIEDDLEDD